MPDAPTPSKSPGLPYLTTSKGKLTTSNTTKVESKLPFNAAPGDEILQYQIEDNRLFTLRASDFDRFMDGQLLNDINIEFGLTLLIDDIRKRDPELADSIHVFNTFFYKMLSTGSMKDSFSKMRRWTRRSGDIFSKKYIVVPINEEYHWYLALIVNPGSMLLDRDDDASSEQDKREVASVLASEPREAAMTPPAPPSPPPSSAVANAAHQSGGAAAKQPRSHRNSKEPSANQELHHFQL